ncbi:MAG TPA: SDR family NAD(P)-dependent oxidoreductase [Acidimicrobiia bacterium]
MGDLVFITGASSGIGLALARSVPFEASVVDVSRSGPPNNSIGHLAADLSDPGTWEKVGSEMVRLIEMNDSDRVVFIHAAGTVNPIGFAGEVDDDAYSSNVILNSAAGQVLGHYFLKAVHDREGTFDLVMISSGAATSVYPGWSSYGAGKAALDHWVRSVGAEQVERGGVRVAAIAPGVVATDMQDEIRDTPERDFPKVDRFHSLYEDGVLSEPEDAAERIWTVIERGVDPGSVVDVRDL